MTEKQTVHKWLWAWDFEKEERWLNAMALSGWVLCGVGWCTFHFERCEPGEYTVRLELRDPEEAYLNLLRENGVEYIGHLFKWQYYRKKTENGAFDLYSDLDSRIAHLGRIGRMLKIVGVLNLIVGVINSVNPAGIGWVNLLCATVLMYGLGRIDGKKETLETERLIRE